MLFALLCLTASRKLNQKTLAYIHWSETRLNHPRFSSWPLFSLTTKQINASNSMETDDCKNFGLWLRVGILERIVKQLLKHVDSATCHSLQMNARTMCVVINRWLRKYVSLQVARHDMKCNWLEEKKANICTYAVLLLRCIRSPRLWPLGCPLL